MNDGSFIAFENEKQIKEGLERWQASALVDAVKNLKECQALRQAVKALEKSKAVELLKDKDNPEKWLELYRAHQVLDQKAMEMGEKEQPWTHEQFLFDALLSAVIRGVMHENLDIDPEEDGLDLNVILNEMDDPADFFDEEIEKDEVFQEALDSASADDVFKVHSRLAHILTKCNNSYTLKRSDYVVETVKMPIMGFLGKSLFPVFGNAVKKVQSKTPSGKGRGDWIDTPTSFILARTNDLLQEAKGRLSMYAEEKEEQEAARIRRKRLILKIKRFFVKKKQKK
ncbi:MAG: hypothetical protein IJ752_01600 [Alphaproteobacteria bacterium]|nr:hypothetical protein [Alphaproteobacteria bacterium]